MAIRTIPVQVGSVELLVEAVQLQGSESTSKVGDAVAAAGDAFAQAQATIVEIASATAETIEAAARRAARPDRLVVEFSLGFTVKGNVLLAGATGEAGLKVTLTYDRTQPAVGGE